MTTTIHPEARKTGFITRKYLDGIKRRLDVHGEPVKHITKSGDIEWVKAQFHEPPENLDLNGIEVDISSNNPYLSGRLDWFPTRPIKFKNQHHAKTSGGSKFVIRGITYQVTDVDPNHRGGVKIHLVRDKCCNRPDPNWATELDEVLCQIEVNCV